MAMDDKALAEEIKEAVGQAKEQTSEETEKMAEAVVEHIKTGIVSNVPTTVTGEAPPSGGPLLNGAATGGIILLTDADLVARFTIAFGLSTAEIIGMAKAISQHVALGLVEFATGSITGTCGNTATSGGPLVGEGTGGAITGLDGDALATLMATLMLKPGASEELKKMAKAIVDHVQDNAEVSYTTPSVTGTCSAGGGPIVAGAGAGGTIL